jgi:hypothetical protein
MSIEAGAIRPEPDSALKTVAQLRGRWLHPYVFYQGFQRLQTNLPESLDTPMRVV